MLSSKNAFDPPPTKQISLWRIVPDNHASMPPTTKAFAPITSNSVHNTLVAAPNILSPKHEAAPSDNPEEPSGLIPYIF